METDIDLTNLLSASARGDKDALDRIVPLVYEQLKEIAHSRLRKEREDHTLNTTGLVHEAYLKLFRASRVDWSDRDHFFAVASSIMRHILVNYALARKALKRGGEAGRVRLDESRIGKSLALDALIDLDTALASLEERHPRAAEVVQHHYFGGFTDDEIASIMRLSSRTVERDLRFARAWLARALHDES